MTSESLLRSSGAAPVLRQGKTRMVKRLEMLDFLERFRLAAEEAVMLRYLGVAEII